MSKKKEENMHEAAKEEKEHPSRGKHSEQIAKEREELRKKTEEYDALWDKYLRLCAEFDNVRKRWERERGEIVKFANFSLLQDMLVVLDEMEQALRMIREHKNHAEICNGIEIMLNNFVKALTKRGIRSIEARGKPFDPHFHEIVSSREVDGIEEPVVLEEVQKGYCLDNKVLRTAKVIVGVGKEPETSNQKPEEQKGEGEQNQDGNLETRNEEEKKEEEKEKLEEERKKGEGE